MIDIAKLYSHLSAFSTYNPIRFEPGSPDDVKSAMSEKVKRLKIVTSNILYSNKVKAGN